MNAAQGKLDQLEGLRGVASFVVLLSHVRLTFFADINEVLRDRYGHIVGTLAEAVCDGNFAVWLFWVMSALVLSIRFHASDDPGSSSALLTDATVRRYPRLLLPVIASVMFAWVLHALGLMTNVKLAELFERPDNDWLRIFYRYEPSVAAAFLSGAWQSFFDYSPATSYNNVLWSMEIELYGSFFLFAYLALLGKHPARGLLYFLTLAVLYTLALHWLNAFVLGTMICDVYVHRESLRRWLPQRVDQACGVLLHNRFLALVLVLPTMYLIGLENIHGNLHLLLAAAITAYVAMSGPAQRLFARRIPVFLGKISFGLYLAHLPILCATAYPLYAAISSVASSMMAACLAALSVMAISIFSGWCLWYLADRPAIAFSRAVARLLTNGLVKK